MARHPPSIPAPWEQIQAYLRRDWDATQRAWARRLHAGRRVRSLVGDILLLHLAFATFIGLLAVGGLWWTSRWVLRDNLRKWAMQWVVELDDLGWPLYASEDPERFLRIEQYVGMFPEIAYVRYYTADARVLYVEYGATAVARNVPLLAPEQLETLSSAPGAGTPFLLDSPLDDSAAGPASVRPSPLGGSFLSGRWLGGSSRFRVSKALWATSISSDGLVDFDLDTDAQGAREERRLLGFVELGLNFSRYRDRLMENVATGSLAITLALLALAFLGRSVFKRALKPLSELEQPMAKLASGNLDVGVAPSGHAEIMAIHNALGATIDALQERDEELRKLANFDSLTGLVSRHFFTEKLRSELMRVAYRGASSALLFVDLDQFKYVNDTAGHAAGDRLLMQAAACLKSRVRRHDVLSRFGGDEFTILARSVTRGEAADLAQSLLEAMRDFQFVENGQSFTMYCSIGITVIDSDRHSPEELLSQADMACHEAKRRGRNRAEFFEQSSDEVERLAADVGWSQKIKEAIEGDGFLLYYQPVVDIADGFPVFHEVLLRLPGKGRKVIAPSAFLPAADRFGLLVEVDHWVIQRALEELGRLRKEGQDVAFALNLSGYTFEEPGLAEYVRETLEANDLPPTAVVFEITEQIAVRCLEETNEAISDLVDMGCGFAIDDFGTGFSSLSYLKQLPADYIKIDGSFIENLAKDPIDQAMVTSIIQVAKAVDKYTIAEYVTDDLTLKLLRRMGVDYAQGFYIGRPARTPVTGPLPRSSRSRRGARRRRP